MVYKTFNPYPLPWRSAKLSILPPDLRFKIFVVACTTLGFSVLALTTIPINGAATLKAGSKNLFQTGCVPQKIF